MANIEKKVEDLILNTIESLGYELYDVIYEKEAQDYYLRIFIDSPNGISLNDCEKVNDSINDMLDEANYIKDQYFLEVSSPGVERLLRKDKHLQANIGKEVVCNLYHPIVIEKEKLEEANLQKNKKKSKKELSLKQIEGVLQNFDENKLVIQVFNDGTEESLEIERKNIATIKLKYHWN